MAPHVVFSVPHDAAPFTMVATVTASRPLAGGIISISAGGPTARHSDRAKAATGASLFNKHSEAAWTSVLTWCFVCLTIHYEWEVLQKLSFLQAMITACICAGMRVPLDFQPLFFFFFDFHVCQRVCQMIAKMEIY